MKHQELVNKWRFDAFANPAKHSDDIFKNIGIYGHKASGITDPGILISIILSFDEGHHLCGWWKNADYDKCLHLSLCIVASRSGHQWKPFKEPAKLPKEEIEAWAKLVFSNQHPDAMKWLWHESGTKSKEIHHLRLFYSKLTNQPILPEGEVYNLKPWGDGEDPEKIFNRCGM